MVRTYTLFAAVIAMSACSTLPANPCGELIRRDDRCVCPDGAVPLDPWRCELDDGTIITDPNAPDGSSSDSGPLPPLDADVECTSPTPYFRDSDGDGFGTDDDVVSSCSPPVGYAEASGDCDDSDPTVHPGARERCNDSDDDCDGGVDEGLVRPVGVPVTLRLAPDGQDDSVSSGTFAALGDDVAGIVHGWDLSPWWVAVRIRHDGTVLSRRDITRGAEAIIAIDGARILAARYEFAEGIYVRVVDTRDGSESDDVLLSQTDEADETSITLGRSGDRFVIAFARRNGLAYAREITVSSDLPSIVGSDNQDLGFSLTDTYQIDLIPQTGPAPHLLLVAVVRSAGESEAIAQRLFTAPLRPESVTTRLATGPRLRATGSTNEASSGAWVTVASDTEMQHARLGASGVGAAVPVEWNESVERPAEPDDLIFSRVSGAASVGDDSLAFVGLFGTFSEGSSTEGVLLTRHDSAGVETLRLILGRINNYIITPHLLSTGRTSALLVYAGQPFGSTDSLLFAHPLACQDSL